MVNFLGSIVFLCIYCFAGCSSRNSDLGLLAVVSCSDSYLYGSVVEIIPSSSSQGRLIDNISFSDALPGGERSAVLSFGSKCLTPLREFGDVAGGFSLAINCDSYQSEMNFLDRGIVELVILPVDKSDPPQVSVGRFIGKNQFVLAEFPNSDQRAWGRYLFGFDENRVSVFGTNSECSYTRDHAFG